MSSSRRPAILCVGIAVQDIVFRVAQFPPPGGKCMTDELRIVSGGCAVNAAIDDAGTFGIVDQAAAATLTLRCARWAAASDCLQRPVVFFGLS